MASIRKTGDTAARNAAARFEEGPAEQYGSVVAAEPAPESPERFEAEVSLVGAARAGQPYVVLATDATGSAGVRLDLALGSGMAKLISWSAGNVSTQGFRIPMVKEVGAFVPLTIDIQGRGLTIRVGDGEPYETVVPADHPAPGGTWGLGVWGDATRWRHVRYR